MVLYIQRLVLAGRLAGCEQSVGRRVEGSHKKGKGKEG
jgi:hypothetical protein